MRSLFLLAMTGCGGPWDAPVLSLGPEGADTEDDLVVAVIDPGPDAPPDAEWTFLWLRDGAAVADLTTSTVPASATVRGETWEVRVSPADHDGDAAVASLVIANAPPTAAVSFEPASPEPGEPIVAHATGTDADVDTVTFRYAWSRNGIPSGHTEAILPADVTVRNELWSVIVTPNDGLEEGPTAAAEVAIGNAAPSIGTVTIGPDSPTERTDILATAIITDADGDVVTESWTWRVNGADVGGVSGPTLTGASFARGDHVIATLTANDGSASSTADSNELVVANAGPEAIDVAIAPEPLRVADIATCSWSSVVDPDGDAVASTEATWRLNGTPVGSGAELAGAFAKGQTLACDVVATDVDGAVGPTITAELVVANTAPVATSATLSDVSPDGGASVTATGIATDADADPVTFTWRWWVDGAEVSTDDALHPSLFAKGDTIQAEGTPTDGDDAGAPVLSNIGTATNSAPLVALGPLVPDPVRTNDTLTITFTASDRDGELVTTSSWWTVDGATVATDITSLPGTAFAKGQTVAFHATANDGLVDGPESTAEIVVADTAPSVAGAEVSPADLHEGIVASCAPLGWSDVDGDLPAYTVEWRVNGALASSDLTLTGADFDRDDSVVCVLTPDTGEAGAPATSAPVIVGNAPPSLAVSTIVPLAPIWGFDDLVCKLGAPAVDLDGDPLTYTARWSNSWTDDYPAATTAQPNDTIPAAETTQDRAWTCVLTADDGQDPVDGSPATVVPTPAGGNILVIIADDLGVDKVAAYGEHPDPPPTPVLDRLADEGVKFRHAYSGPVCAPTRANMMTGRYGRRHGVGKIIDVWSYDYALPANELPLPAVLNSSAYFSYSNSFVGKWHLGSRPEGPTHPADLGWSWHAGSLGNLADPTTIDTIGKKDYGYWERDDNGLVSISTEYATIQTTDDALDRIAVMPEPWMLWLAYNAPHEPLHAPPASLHSFVGLDDASSDYDKYQAMVESLDSELGRLLVSIDPAVLDATTVFFIGDNGTPKHGISAPFDPEKGKGSVHEGGVNVPLIVRAPHLGLVGGTESTAFVHAVDLFTTISVIVGVDPGELEQQLPDGTFRPIALDGQSILPYLSDPMRVGARETMFVERFEPNGKDPFSSESVAIRDERWKLIRAFENGKEAENFFDLVFAGLDVPVEGLTEDLLLTELDEEQQAAYDRLSAALDAQLAQLTYDVPEYAPDVYLAAFLPNPPYQGEDISCIAAGWRDGDDDEVTFTYDWELNGVPLAVDGDTLTSDQFVLGDEVSCTITASDGLASGASATATVTIVDAPPTLQSVQLTPDPANSADTLLCSALGVEDPDSDVVEVHYQWRVGFDQLELDQPTLDNSWFVRGNDVQCGVTLDDGVTETAEEFSNIVIIANHPPTAPIIEVQPSEPEPGVDDLWCGVLVDAYDADLDVLGIDVSWTVDGVDWAGPTDTLVLAGDTIPAAETEDGQLWVCNIKAHDGLEFGDIGQAAAWTWEIAPEIWPQGLDFRPTNATCVAGDRRPSGASAELVPAYSLLLEEPVFMTHPPGDDTWWYVVLQDGEIVRFLNQPDTESFDVVMDIQDAVRNEPGEQAGMMGLAFSPDFGITGEVYIFYTANGNDLDIASYIRISRFTSFDGGATFDPASEEILYELPQQFIYHKGGHLSFDADGYLWFAIGDGGGLLDPLDHGQDLFSSYSKIHRVDPTVGYPWGIPADNPYADGVEGLPEIWASGFRNPWRFTYDDITEKLWVGDVGSQDWEEVSVLTKGQNAGWSVVEGTHCVDPADCDTTGITMPIVEWSHNGGAAAVIGGLVYRGSAIPGLVGTYLYTDYYGGTPLEAIRDIGGGSYVVENIIPATGLRIASFAADEAGEVYAVDYLQGQIYQLVPTEPEPDSFPRKLSETGCVDPLDPTLPSTAMIPFDVTVALWSDDAEKSRYLAIPDGTTIELGDDGDFEFPIGTVMLKTFAYDGVIFETRLLMRHNDGEWAGYTYQWNEDHSDADLLDDNVTTDVMGRSWTFPTAQCMDCHTSTAGRAVGPETLQLNSTWAYPNGRLANQIATWEAIGLFATDPGPPETLPALPALDDETSSLQDRGRAYLHANCAHCHGEGAGSGPQDFHYLAEFPNYCDVVPFGEDLGAGADARILAPGHPEHSVLYLRMADLGAFRMPPLGSEVLDLTALGLIEAWIDETEVCTF